MRRKYPSHDTRNDALCKRKDSMTALVGYYLGSRDAGYDNWSPHKFQASCDYRNGEL